MLLFDVSEASFGTLKISISVLHRQYQICCSFDAYVEQGLYQPNTLCTFLGAGDPDLAYSRLASTYHQFGITEFFSASLALFAQTLPFPVQGFSSLNTTDSSSQIEIKPQTLRKLEIVNQKDLALYQKACSLFWERLSDRQISTDKMHLAESTKKKRVHFDQKVATTVKTGSFEEAYQALDGLGPDQSGYLFAKLDLCLRWNAFSRAIEVCHQINRLHPGVGNLDLVGCLAKIDPQRGIQLLEQELARVLPLQTRLPDSSMNNYIQVCFNNLETLWNRTQDAVKNEEGFVQGLQRLIARCEEYYCASTCVQTLPCFFNLITRLGLEKFLTNVELLREKASPAWQWSETVRMFLKGFPPGTKILLYGCGEIARLLVDRGTLEPLNCIFVTSFKSDSANFHGYPLGQIDDFREQPIHYLIILSQMHEAEMLSRANFFDRSRIFTLNEMIDAVHAGGRAFSIEELTKNGQSPPPNQSFTQE
ncbi:MAG: hypothetical protein H6510_09470 [Acidobacteria bacterium]|nr:hypothetical protein [Acidobacteriota bacterium]MCB9398034.1 hypothetical protein [Acidobacteriota bacterium]